MKFQYRPFVILINGICLLTLLGCVSTDGSNQVIEEPSIEIEAPPPNLNGIWQAVGSAHWNLEGHIATKGPVTEILGAMGGIPAGMGVVEGGVIPYRPEALARRNDNRANWHKLDPAVKCYIPGIPRLTYMPFPLQIFQSSDKIFIAYEFGSNSRLIHMDKPGPAAPLPSWMGYSLGHWEDQTLVVKVTDQVPDTWFDSAGNYHSDVLKVIERYTPVGPNHIHYEAIIEDPKIYTRPWKISMPLYRRLEENARILEYKCVEFAEDVLYKHLRKGAKTKEPR